MRMIIHEPHLAGGFSLRHARLVMYLTFLVFAALLVALAVLTFAQTDRVDNSPPPAQQGFVHPSVEGIPLTKI